MQSASLVIPPASSLIAFDCAFWGVRMQGVYRLGFQRWSFEHADTVVSVITQTLGPDLFSTLVTMLPSIMSKQVRLVDGLTGVLVERADAMRDALLGLLRSGLRDLVLFDMYAVQQASAGASNVAIVQPVTGDQGVLATRAPAFDGVFDVYLCALGALCEQLFPLAVGSLALRQQSTPLAPTTEETRDPLATLKTQGQSLAMMRHLDTWLKCRTRGV